MVGLQNVLASTTKKVSTAQCLGNWFVGYGTSPAEAQFYFAADEAGARVGVVLDASQGVQFTH